MTRSPGASVAAAALAVALTAAVGGCGASDTGGGGVVVTTNILGDVVDEIVGETTETTVLMRPNANPHSFGLSAKQAALLENADLIVYNGLGLEENVLHHVEAAQRAGVATVEVAARVDPLEYAEGASAGTLDPHFWTDPARMRAAVSVVRKEIVAHVPNVDAERVGDNAETYAGKVEELDAEIADEFEAIPVKRRKLVTNHHVFGYLAERYDFEVVGAVIPSGTTLASPSAADLESLAQAVREAGVRAVFADSSQPGRLAEAMAAETGLDIEVIALHSESLSASGGRADTYLAMVEANAEAITRGLS